MPNFDYIARDRGGRIHRGSTDAAAASDLVSTLRNRGWLVTQVQPAALPARGLMERIGDLNPAHYLAPRSIDVEISLTQLAVMLRGGLTLLAALGTLVEQSPRRKMKQIWRSVADSIQEGSGLADAMSRHSCFSKLVIQLARVGEQTGNLEQVLVRSAALLENRRQTKNSLITAAAYPSVVLVAAIGVSVFMIVSVIPKLQVFLTALGRELPAMTQLLVDIGGYVQIYGLHFAVATIAMLVALISIYLWPPGRYFLDRAMLRVPILGNLLRLAATAMFANSFATLIRSGVTMLESLRTVELLHRNRYLREHIAVTRDAVMRGRSLAQPLGAGNAFTPMLASMVAVGETTGTLDDVLDEVAKFHDQRLKSAIRQFSLIIEPVTIIVVGAIVGFVYISFFLAMFSAAGASR
ncbi:MAG: type II secretion system F family protein [Planctomycetaceae bacterium]|nr:MAG: type II secretion system F family protein [Planctomycetaceae bacterium]